MKQTPPKWLPTAELPFGAIFGPPCGEYGRQAPHIMRILGLRLRRIAPISSARGAEHADLYPRTPRLA